MYPKWCVVSAVIRYIHVGLHIHRFIFLFLLVLWINGQVYGQIPILDAS